MESVSLRAGGGVSLTGQTRGNAGAHLASSDQKTDAAYFVAAIRHLIALVKANYIEGRFG